MHNGTTASLLPNLLAQSHRRAFASATGTIAFGEGFVAAQAPKPSFVQDQFDAMSPQWHIAFDPLAYIMLFDADAATMGTTRSLIGSDHFDSDPSIGLHLLFEDAQSF